MAQKLLERAARWAKDRFDASTSILVDYTRGVHSVEALKAIPRRPEFGGSEPTEGAQATALEMDFVIAAEDLVLDSVRVTPLKGDVIRYVRPDLQIAFYDVLPVADGRCYTISDNEGILYRVHGKLNRIEAPPV